MMEKTLETLCSIDSVSYSEEKLEKKIIKLIPKDCEILKDNLDNLIVRKKGNITKKNIAILASIDEIGLIATKIQEEGSVSFLPLGDIDIDIIKGSVMHFKNDLNAVIGANPIHMQTNEDKIKETKIEDLFLDFGFKSKKEAEQFIEIGDVFSFKCEYEKISNYSYKAKALGDRFCCLTLLELLKSSIKNEITCIFLKKEKTVPEASKTAIYLSNPDYCIILKPYYIKKEKLDEEKKPLVFPICNGSLKYSRQLLDLASEVAFKNEFVFEKIACKNKNKVAQNVAKSRKGVETAVLSFPCKQFGAIETAKIEDLKCFLNFTKKYIEYLT